MFHRHIVLLRATAQVEAKWWGMGFILTYELLCLTPPRFYIRPLKTGDSQPILHDPQPLGYSLKVLLLPNSTQSSGHGPQARSAIYGYGCYSLT